MTLQRHSWSSVLVGYAVSMFEIHNMVGGNVSLYSHGWPNKLLTWLMLTIGEVWGEIF